MGLEVQALSWLAIRSSITQTFFVDQSRDEVGYPTAALPASNGALSEFPNGANNTKVSAGLGINFNKISVDGSLISSTTQQLNQNNFLTQLGVKYAF